MHIALVYDLRRDYLNLGFSEEAVAEFDSDATVEALDATLTALGHRVERVGHIFALAPKICAGQTWDLVFNICEGLYDRNREAQVPALLEAFRIPYTFSDPLTLSLTLDKAMAKAVVQAAGWRTPAFVSVETPADITALPRRWVHGYPAFVKPLCEGTGKGITADCVVGTPDALCAQVRVLLERYQQPVLVETYLPGREFTVGIVGTGEKARMVAGMEVLLLDNAERGVYSYTNKELCEDRVQYQLITEPELLAAAESLALGTYRALGCRDAGRVDLRADAQGQLHFLEVNPLAGLHPTHSDLPILSHLAGWSYEQLIAAIVASAASRPMPGRPAIEKALRLVKEQG